MAPVLQKLLDTELSNHLECDKYGRNSNTENMRNGYCKPKKVKTESGEIEVKTPRDRLGTFSPVIIEKGQTELTGFQDKCITLYAKGVSLRDIELILKDLYKVDINKNHISALISAVSEETNKWRNRPLKPLYSFVYADCIYVPVKDEISSKKRAVYVLIGIDANGYKDVLGLWINDTESASFWCEVFEDIKSRGVKDILYVTSDGIAGFKGSIDTVFPNTLVQRCVVHLSRNIYALCPKKEAKDIIKGFKNIYTQATLSEAIKSLETFKKTFSKHKHIVSKVEQFMVYLEPLYELPKEIRTYLYTSNAIESVNSALRKVTRGKSSFPSEEALFKILYLRICDLTKNGISP